MKKNYVLFAVFLLMTLGLVGTAYATSDNTKANPMSNLVQAIASKFNLSESDVQAVFDAQKVQMEAQRETQRTEMEAKRTQEFADRLSQAVTEGKLTQEQADKITAKKAELKTQKTNLEGKTEEERQTAMQEQKDSLKQWATDNNIPQEYILFMGGFEMGRGHMGPGGPRTGQPPDKTTDSSVQTQ